MKQKHLVIDTYKFEELSQDVKDKLISQELDYSSYINAEFFTETCQELLANNLGSDLSLEYSLNYCQGDGVAFYGKLDNDILLNSTRLSDSAKKTLRRLTDSIDIFIAKSSYGHWYSHYNTMYVDIYPSFNTGEYKHIDLKLEALELELTEIKTDISKELEEYGYKVFYDYDGTIDYIIELDYDYTIDGKIVD